MINEDVLRDFSSLPPEAQRQVADFIAFLLVRYGRSRLIENYDASQPTTSDFIGMWRDRSDLQNSSMWVRMMREREWGE